jgi:hypothetical protein
MSQDSLAPLIDRYLNDPFFRAEFAHDPEAAIAAGGFTLDDDEREALHAAFWTHDDQPLKARVSRFTFGS